MDLGSVGVVTVVLRQGMDIAGEKKALSKDARKHGKTGKGRFIA